MRNSKQIVSLIQQKRKTMTQNVMLWARENDKKEFEPVHSFNVEGEDISALDRLTELEVTRKGFDLKNPNVEITTEF